MTRDIESATAEYFEVADSLERWDAKPEKIKPVLRSLGMARRRLIDRITAFEQIL